MSKDEGFEALQKVGAGTLRAGTPLLLWLIYQQLQILTEKVNALSLAIAHLSR